MSSIKNKYKNSPCSPPSTLTDDLPGSAVISSLKLKVLKNKAQALMLELEEFVARQPLPATDPIDFYEEVERFEINLILWALEQTGGKQTQAARLLGLKKTTLNAMIKKYELNKRADGVGLNNLVYEMAYNSKGVQ